LQSNFFVNAGTDKTLATYAEEGSVRSPMNKEYDYRRSAVDTMKLAKRASSSEEKGRLLRLAEAWLELADRANRTAKRLRGPSVLHPLVQNQLDQYLE
jgi:hypothetical protein